MTNLHIVHVLCESAEYDQVPTLNETIIGIYSNRWSAVAAIDAFNKGKDAESGDILASYLKLPLIKE